MRERSERIIIAFGERSEPLMARSEASTHE
jgi:hypothetical protein